MVLATITLAASKPKKLLQKKIGSSFAAALANWAATWPRRWVFPFCWTNRKKAKAPAKKKDKKPNRVARWLKDLRGELKKVTWPSAKDTAKNVGTVIVCVLLVGVLIWVFDWVVKLVVEALLNLF